MIKFLKNLLKWKVSIESNTIYIKREEKMYWHSCEQCKKGYWNLPNYKCKNYIYKFTDDNFNVELQPQVEDTDFKIYGWVIQEKYKGDYMGRPTNWYDSSNHKLYATKIAALDALNQMNKSYNRIDKYEFRVKPVYHIDTIKARNLLITELLKKEK